MNLSYPSGAWHRCSARCPRLRLLAGLTLLVAVDSLPAVEPCKTRVGGTIANQTWTREDSPYCVTNDVYVIGSLRIREGVEVRFDGNHVFEVAGRLRAEGTAEAPIQFHPANPAVGWQGLLFRDAVPGSYFVHTIIEGSKNSGVRISGTAPTFTNCVFSTNRSAAAGGAISASLPGSSLSVEGCSFSGNVSESGGGALYVNGKAVVRNAAFERNRADGSGAACWAAGDCELIDTTFTENVGGSYGSVMLFDSGRLRLRNVRMRGNSGPRSDSQLVWAEGNVQVLNSLFANNRGTAVGTARGSSLSLLNSTLASNTGGAIYANQVLVTLTNSIVWGNGWREDRPNGGAVAYAYCCVQGDTPEGPGNLSVAPALCPDNYSLIDGSPCIDAGHPGLEFRDGCRSDEPCSPFARGGPRNDMGAYGGPGVCYWTQPRAEPVLRIAPENQIGFLGQRVSLDVIATGAEPLVYQWFKSGVALVGRTNMVLTLPNSTLADAGAYVVEVTNPLGEAVSLPVQLGIAKYACVAQGFSAGRPRLLIRHGWVGERCVLYSISRLPAGDTLAVPGNPPEGWEVRETIVFSAPEVEWTDPQVLGAGETRYYGVLPAL